jgi:Na+-transporting NADH:ubiquinone oxidoreductase subunit A
MNMSFKSQTFRIRKGLDIRLKGQAEKMDKIVHSKHVVVKPTDFHGLTPKVLVKEGESVKAGSVLFIDKYNPKIVFAAPVSGKVTQIERGDKRKVLAIHVEADELISYADMPNFQMGTRDEIIEKLLQTGLWAFMRQRPFDVIADPNTLPKALFVSAFDSSPLAPDFDYMVEKDAKYFQAGLDLLKQIVPVVHLSVHQKMTAPAFLQAQGVQIHTFEGPHPAGNVGTQIHHIDPINKGETAWVMGVQGVIAIGKAVLDKKYDVSRWIAITGELEKPCYVKTIAGALMQDILAQNIDTAQYRVISGNALTGDQVGTKGYLGFYHHQVTVLLEGKEPKFVLTEGWLSLGLKRFSNSKLYPAAWFGNKTYQHDTNLNGEERAFVVTGELERVFPFDIYPMQILKSMMYQDLDEMEKLGIYEVAPEDFALCEYVCTSKINMQEIVRGALDLVQKECV